jgi:hypothetical protein
MKTRSRSARPVLAVVFLGTLAEALQIPAGAFTIDVDGKLEARYVQRTESDTPREDPQGKVRLRVGADLAPKVRFQSDVTGIAGGSPRHPRGAGIFDLDDTKQDISPSLELEEAYLDVVLPSLDARIGIQKFAWGKLDAIQPNDLLNPEKFYDPVLEDENDRKVGLPALSGTFYFPAFRPDALPSDLRLTAVFAPIVVPFHFPDDDERWYPPLARVPRETQSGGFTVRNESSIANREVPDHGDPGNAAGAARFAGLFHGADFALYYYDGYDSQPALDVDARGFVRFDPLNPQLFDVRSEITIFPVFDRVRAAGFDVAYNFLGVTVRGEAAYVVGRLYPRSVRSVVESQQVGAIDPVTLLSGEEQQIDVELDPVNVERDGVEWGFGGDTLWNDTFVLVQMNQTAVLENDEDLLISDHETRIAATVRRTFFDDKLEAELIGYYGVQGVYGLAHPRVTVNVTDDFDVRVGYVLIEGHTNSFLGQYKHNDESYVRARYSF